MKIKQFLRLNAFGGIWSFCIAILSLTESAETGSVLFFGLVPIDKVLHIIVYFLVCVLTLIGFRKQDTFESIRSKSMQFAVLYSISLGVLLEICQHILTVTRVFDIFDILFNIIGCILALGFYRYIYRGIPLNVKN